MTDQEINVAIAEACGWKQIHFYKPDIHIDPFEPSEWRGLSPVYGIVRLPDYANDLNAMHEAEDVLANDSIRCAITDYELLIEKRSTARQRAEAFLRTVGKWKEAAQ